MSNKLLRIVMLGAPAAGKGTLSKRIVQKFNYAHISPGDILLLNILNKTKLGQQVSAYMEQGLLVPDDLVIQCVMNSIVKATNSKHSIILDGFPRTLAQAKLLHAANIAVDVIFNLQVPDAITMERVHNRWIHLPSGRIYNKGYNEPRHLWKDDVTGEDLVQRPDDHPAIAMKRLHVYHNTVRPVFEFYNKQTNVDVLHLKGNSTEDIWPGVHKYLEMRNQLNNNKS